MATNYLKPQEPLKKIDKDTGDINYLYPLVTDDQVILEDGQRLNTLLSENIIYYGEADVESSVEVINADTWSGHTPTTFLSLVYPVGAIYMSANSTSPDVLFGFGTWEKIEDRFLLAASSTYSAGATGGEATHTLTVNEMPDHYHGEFFDFGNGYVRPIADTTTSSSGTETTALTDGTYKILSDSFNHNSASTSNPVYPIITSQTGGSQAHNNMPPYLAVYVWKRTV